MSAMTQELSDEVVLVVRGALSGQVLEFANGAGGGEFFLKSGLDRRPHQFQAPQWQPLVLLREEDATWEDAEWQ